MKTNPASTNVDNNIYSVITEMAITEDQYIARSQYYHYLDFHSIECSQVESRTCQQTCLDQTQ